MKVLFSTLGIEMINSKSNLQFSFIHCSVASTNHSALALECVPPKEWATASWNREHRLYKRKTC